MLADVAARLGDDWRLIVCGEGPLEDELRARIDALGVADRVELRGYLPLDGGLMDLYRSADAFLHVSWTEGVPQVLLEAFAAGTPVVATAVGGVPEAVGEAALLIPPGDPDAAARALGRLASEPGLRRAARRARAWSGFAPARSRPRAPVWPRSWPTRGISPGLRGMDFRIPPGDLLETRSDRNRRIASCS